MIVNCSRNRQRANPGDRTRRGGRHNQEGGLELGQINLQLGSGAVEGGEVPSVNSGTGSDTDSTVDTASIYRGTEDTRLIRSPTRRSEGLFSR